MCDGELDVNNDFGECGAGSNQGFGGGILLNGRVCQIVKGRSHLLCLVEFGSLICTKPCVAGSHAIDIAHLGNGGGPMSLPVGPNVVNNAQRFHLRQTNVMLPHARACLVPVVW